MNVTLVIWSALIPVCVIWFPEGALAIAQGVVSEVARAVFVATPAIFLTGVMLGLWRRGWL